MRLLLYLSLAPLEWPNIHPFIHPSTQPPSHLSTYPSIHLSIPLPVPPTELPLKVWTLRKAPASEEFITVWPGPLSQSFVSATLAPGELLSISCRGSLAFLRPIHHASSLPDGWATSTPVSSPVSRFHHAGCRPPWRRSSAPCLSQLPPLPPIHGPSSARAGMHHPRTLPDNFSTPPPLFVSRTSGIGFDGWWPASVPTIKHCVWPPESTVWWEPEICDQTQRTH